MGVQTLDGLDEGRGAVRTLLPYAVVALLLLVLAWLVWDQMTSVRGIKIEAPSPQAIEMLPPPPPPPPPPPEEVKPPEPTEQPQPAPVSEAPQAPQPEAPVPMTMNAPAAAGPSAYNLPSGSGAGAGSPGGPAGTCLAPPCGTGQGGGGVRSTAVYAGYLQSVLQDRVQDDPRLGRLVFSANVSLTVTGDGRITAVRLRGARGGSDADMAKLTALLAQVRGLDPPPPRMTFPQLIEVRGRRSAF